MESEKNRRIDLRVDEREKDEGIGEDLSENRRGLRREMVERRGWEWRRVMMVGKE